MSAATAIQVCDPAGQIGYLARLRCADDAPPTYTRTGQHGYRNPRNGDDDYRRSADQVKTGRSLEPGETDLHPVDLYAVVCASSATTYRIHFDMYHCATDEQTVEAPVGLTIVTEK
jgi:hypothetical protein